MSRPSDALLRWLRSKLDEQGHKTAAIAKKLEKGRKETRAMLTGSAPMTVDELMQLTEMLNLSPEDMALPAGAALEDLDEAEIEEPLHWSNQPRALFEFGFDLGIDFMFVVDVSKLGDDWGGPDEQLKRPQHKREMPMRLDAAYHQYMEPKFDDDGVSVVISFDKLYRCVFPWESIARVIFIPYYDENRTKPTPEPEPEKKKGGFLRLVT